MQSFGLEFISILSHFIPANVLIFFLFFNVNFSSINIDSLWVIPHQFFSHLLEIYISNILLHV